MRTKLWNSLALVLLLATGFACAWAMLIGFGMAIFETNSSRMHYFENIQVDANGEAWIARTHYGHLGVGSFGNFNRTLEGEPLEVSKGRNPLSAGSLLLAENNKHDSQPSWRQRVHRIVEMDGKEFWFTVHNGEKANGRMYLAGYDMRSKLLVGYLGENGFQIEIPTPEQSFAVDGRVLGYNGGGFVLNESADMAMTHGPGRITTFQSRHSSDVSVASADGLMQVNLKDRIVNALDESDAYLSVANCSIPGRVLTSIPEGIDPNEIKPYGEDPEFDRYYQKQRRSTVVARQQERVVVFHPVKKERYKFAIPTDLQSHNFDFRFISPELAVLNVYNHTREGWFNELFWINAQGEVQKSKQVWLNRDSVGSERFAFAIGGIIAPIPLLVVGVMLVMLPYNKPYRFDSASGTSYGNVLAEILADAWPMLTVLLLLSAVLTWLAWRWHRKYARSHTAVWCGVVFLLGLPGFVAYRLHFARPPLGKCGECGEPAPRDRDACAHCNQPFAEPVLRGTEIFA